MTCCRCKGEISKGQKYRYLSGAGDIHVPACPPDPQAALFGEDDLPPSDGDASYPDGE